MMFGGGSGGMMGGGGVSQIFTNGNNPPSSINNNNNHHNDPTSSSESQYELALSKQLVTITLINLLNHILFESDTVGPSNTTGSASLHSSSSTSIAAPCLLRLIPYFIHFHPNILRLYVNRLIKNISTHACHVVGVEPSLVAIRLQQQSNVIYVWASATVTGQRGVSLPPMAVINLPQFTPNMIGSGGVGSGSGGYSTSSSSTTSKSISSGGRDDGYGVTVYEISDLVDLSTSQVLALFAKVVTGVVTKPTF